MSRRCPTRLARLQPDDWRRRLTWSGREFDAETGLYYHRARYLDPTTGRWTTQDPLGVAAGDANLYRYFGNTPTLATDPSGYSEQLPLWVQFVNSWDNVLGHHRIGWFARVSDGAAGWEDAVSFGVTSYIRQGLGYDSVVDYSGGAYTVGQVDGTVNSFLLGYGAAGRVPQTRIWAYRAAQEYTVAGSVYGVGHSSYVLATDPQNFGFGDALGFLPLGGYVTSVARFGRTAGRVTVGSTGENILPAETVRQIGRGERVNNLIHEVAELTYTSGGREHAIISLPDGRRLIVRGGEGGMTFPDGLRRVILHTHPRPTGPSPLDFQMLELTGQRSSWIYELFGGGLTKFGR